MNYGYVFVKLGLNRLYPIVNLNIELNQVTFQEAPNIYNTVSLNDVVLIAEDGQKRNYLEQ